MRVKVIKNVYFDTFEYLLGTLRQMTVTLHSSHSKQHKFYCHSVFNAATPWLRLNCRVSSQWVTTTQRSLNISKSIREVWHFLLLDQILKKLTELSNKTSNWFRKSEKGPIYLWETGNQWNYCIYSHVCMYSQSDFLYSNSQLW